MRDLRLDTLRGIFLVLMMLDHLPWDKTPITGEILGFVSAAEGFVFLSGMVSGLVYGRSMIKYGFDFGRRKIIMRTGKIYIYYLLTVVAMITMALIFPFLHDRWHALLRPLTDEPFKAVLFGAFFLYQPGFCDILPLYVIFMGATVWLLPWMMRGCDKWIMAGSIGLWIMAQLGATDRIVNLFGDLWVRHGIFDMLAWQLVFVFGLYLGNNQARGKGLSGIHQSWVFWFCLSIAIVCALLRHRLITQDPEFIRAMVAMERKNELAPLRLLDCAAVAVVFAGIAQWKPRLLSWRPLYFLGQHSLQVFTGHIFVVYGIFLWKGTFQALSPWIQWFVVGSGTVAMLFMFAWLHRLYEKNFSNNIGNIK